VRNKKKANKEPPHKERKGKQPNTKKPNSFAILQVEEDEEDQHMDHQEDKGSDYSETSERILAKRKAPIETQEVEKEPEEPMDQMEIDQESSREDLSQEEEVLEKLLQEWKYLDERFIPETQKKLYTETFQQYKAKLEKGKAPKTENQETQKETRSDQNGQTKGGKKEEDETSRTPYNSWVKP